MQSRYTHGDGTPFTKEEFLQKLKTDSEFNDEFGNKGIDQISELIKQLKDNPDSRRMIVSAWAVHDLPNMTLPPCHYGFQVYTRELSFDERHLLYCKSFEGTDDNHKGSSNSEQMTEYHNKRNIPTRAISLMFNMRSVDTFLGLPFNIASYGLLLEIIAKAVNMVPDELIGNLGDTHLYLNHVDQAKEQIGRELSLEERHQLALPIWKEKYGPLADMMVMTNVDNTPYKIPRSTREPYPLPTLMIYDDMRRTDGFNVPFDELDHSLIKLIDYQSHPTIKAPLSN